MAHLTHDSCVRQIQGDVFGRRARPAQKGGAVIYRSLHHPGLKGNLAILVEFDDRSRVSFGSTDVPVRFKIVEDDLFTLSCEHESPDR